MKAILVIDVNEKYIGTIGTDIQFTLTNHGYDCKWEIKSMPQKKEHQDEIDYDYGYIDGWNACVEEISNDR